MEFSSSLKANDLPTNISSRADVETLLLAFGGILRNKIQLWQYYVLDRSRELKGVAIALTSPIRPWDGPELEGKTVEELTKILVSCGKIQGLGEYKARYHVCVDSSIAASFLRAAYPDIEDTEVLSNRWANIVDVINVPLYEEWEEDTCVALQNIRNRLEYTRLADHGPKLGEINAQLVHICFNHSGLMLTQVSIGRYLFHSSSS